MIIRYIHIDNPDESRYYDTRNAWKNTPASLGGEGSCDEAEFAMREICRFNEDLNNGIVLSYEICKTHDFYITIGYLEIDVVCPDTVHFILPVESTNVLAIGDVAATLANAIDDAMETIDRDECGGTLDWLDEVFDSVAERMHGSWKYLEITKYIEV